MIIFDLGGIAIISNYLNSSVADENFQKLLNELDWQERKIFLFGKWMNQPRLIDWNADQTYYYSKVSLGPKKWHPFIFELKDKIKKDFDFDFNHALVNLYRDEKDSMSWHADDEKELGIQPLIISYSLGETRKFLLCKKKQAKVKKNILELELKHNDLLIMYPPLQEYWYHAVPKEKRKKEVRINISFRKIVL